MMLGKRKGWQDGCYNSLLAEVAACPQLDHSTVTLIIMYIYHALINTLSAHMIHINLNARQLKRAAPAWLSWTKSNLTEGFLVLFLSWCTQTRRIYTNTVCFLLPLLFVKGHFVEILHQSKTIFLFLFFFYLCLKNFDTGYQLCFSFSILLLKATAVPVQWAHTLHAAHSQCRTRTSPCLPSAKGTHKAMKKKNQSNQIQNVNEMVKSKAKTVVLLCTCGEWGKRLQQEWTWKWPPGGYFPWFWGHPDGCQFTSLWASSHHFMLRQRIRSNQCKESRS